MESWTELLKFITSGSTESMFLKLGLLVFFSVLFLSIKYGEKWIDHFFERKKKKVEKEEEKEAMEEVTEEVEELEEKVDKLLDGYQKFYDLEKTTMTKIPMTDKVPLSEHPLFSSMRDMDLFFSVHLKLPDKGRELLMKEKVIPKIRIWYRILLEMTKKIEACIEGCSNCSTNSCGKSEIICHQAYLNGIDAYRNYYIDHPYSLQGIEYTEEDLHTMSIYNERFNAYHSVSERMVSDSIERIYKSNVYHDCYARTWDVLTAYLYAFNRVKIDSEGAIRKLNGELTGLNFLGIKIGEFEYDEY